MNGGFGAERDELREDQDTGAGEPLFDPTSEELMRTVDGRENPQPLFIRHVSGSVHPVFGDLEEYAAPPEQGAIGLPSTIPLVNTDPHDPLQREAFYGLDLVLQDRERSTHTLVLGMTGAGKNVRVIDPLRASAIRDPGQTVISFSLKAADIGPVREMCRATGKRLVVLNLGNPARSVRWNPLETDDADKARDLIRRFCEAARNPLAKDSEFWIQWVRCGLQGCWEEGIRSFPLMLEFFSQPYDRAIEQLRAHRNASSNRLAEYLSGHSQNAETVMASILGTLTSMLSRGALRVMATDELRLARLFRKPVCLHVEIDEAELETHRPLVQMLARCVIDALIDTAEACGGKRVPATVFFDDMPSLGGLLSVERLLTLRSRRVGIVAGVQSINSLELAYGTAYRSLLEAFAHKIVLAGCAQPDADYFSHASGESFVALPCHEGQTPVFANQPLLSAADIRRPTCEHNLLGRPATLFFGAVCFQAYLQRSYELPGFARVLRASRHVTGRERLRRSQPPCPTLAELRLGPTTASVDTRGWDRPRLLAYLERLKAELGWPEALLDSTATWWTSLEIENHDKLDLVVRFAEALRARSGTVSELVRATRQSRVKNLQGNLLFMEYLRFLRQEEREEEARRARWRTGN